MKYQKKSQKYIRKLIFSAYFKFFQTFCKFLKCRGYLGLKKILSNFHFNNQSK